MAQLVASMSSVVLGGVVEVLGSNLARDEIKALFIISLIIEPSYINVVLDGVAMLVGSDLARGKISSIRSADSLFIYCMKLHSFLILCSSKVMMFVRLYFRTSDIYLISLVSLEPPGFHLRTK